ncbi:Rtf2 RING-finger-domain-containing protein [Phlyctochytrium arcticum]|nr:Rtf2 RING-finger-domain-containing protein [Phlyctochytrium arcticum]
MGCDGGSIPKRHELVRVKKATERVDPKINQVSAWFFCALSKQLLAPPVVACGLGKLYNKDAVLEFLLNKGGFGDGDIIAKHITSFKDVTTLNLEPNPVFKSADAPTSSSILGNIDERPFVAKFCCPVTGREMNGNYRFSYISSCGCVFSEQALKQVPGSICLKCNQPYAADDLLPINPSDGKEIKKLEERMEKAKAARVLEAEEKKRIKKANKKTKGKKMDDNKAVPALRTSSGSELESPDTEPSVKKRKKAKKSAESDSEDDAPPQAKKTAAAQNINMPLPDLSDRSQLPLAMRVQSEAIKSLYKKGEDKGNFLTRGTFNRFAASF